MWFFERFFEGEVLKPNLFLFAAPRSGSTQLARWLSDCEDIYLPPIKEPNYFSSDEFGREYVQRSKLNDVNPERYVNGIMAKPYQFAIFRTIEAYEALFRFSGNKKYVLDASTTYLHHSGIARKIREYNPESKIIILIRDPLTRMVSHYNLAKRTGRVINSISVELGRELSGQNELCENFLIRQSCYNKALTECLDVFPKNQIHIVMFEDVIKNPELTLLEISRFLSVDLSSVCTVADEKNESLVPRLKYFHYLLNKSGAKSVFRRVLSVRVKRAIKKFYFTRPPIVHLDEIDDIAKNIVEGDWSYAQDLINKFLAEPK
jgi:hypothetical protein